MSSLSGQWNPNPLQGVYYGPSCVENNLISLLPSETSKAFIITGTSLATKTPIITKVEHLLTPTHHAGTFSKIAQHAPVSQIDEAASEVAKDPSIDTVISIGGGSPIDAAKAISHRLGQSTDDVPLRPHFGCAPFRKVGIVEREPVMVLGDRHHKPCAGLLK